MRKALLVTARSAGIPVVMLVSLLACSSQPERPKQNPARAAGGSARQGTEEARLARKAKAKDEALVFVRVAQNACQELTRTIEALTPDSTLDSDEMNAFIPLGLYPTEPFGAYVDEATFADVKSQLNQVVSSVVGLLRSLERRRQTAATLTQRQPDDLTRDQVAFRDEKLRTIAVTHMYCESVKRAGSGLGTLR